MALSLLYCSTEGQGHNRVHWTRELRQPNGEGVSLMMMIMII